MTDKRTYCFIINCASNSFKAESFFKTQEGLLAKTFNKTEFIYIRKEDSIVDIVREKVKSNTHIIACGGDGTVNKVVNGMIGSDAILGVLPLGSGNDFAQSIGLEKHFKRNLSTLLNNEIRAIDVIKIHSGYFINTYGIGVDGLTNYYASQSGFKIGAFKYFISGFKALLNSNPFQADLKIDGTESNISDECWMIAIANGKSEGGRYQISPQSLNYDGKVEVIVVKAISRIRLIGAFIRLSFGFSFSDSLVEKFQFIESCEVKTEIQLKQHADGEQISDGTEISFRLIKSAVSVVVAP